MRACVGREGGRDEEGDAQMDAHRDAAGGGRTAAAGGAGRGDRRWRR